MKKLIGKESRYYERNEIVKIENEVVIFEIVLGIVHGQPLFFKTSPMYHFRLLVTKIIIV